jgi:uncharacterized protein (DUF305 family)
MAAQSDQNEIALSQLAQQKAANPAVKAFAEKMVTEHTKMTESMKPFADSWGLTPLSGSDADHQKARFENFNRHRDTVKNVMDRKPLPNMEEFASMIVHNVHT